MEQLPLARSNKRTVGWWEYPVIVLIALSALPAYVAFLTTALGWVVLEFHSTLPGAEIARRLDGWGYYNRFFAILSCPVGVAICIVVSLASFRSRAMKLGWLVCLGGILAWFAATAILSR
jgi:hypothetical protein